MRILVLLPIILYLGLVVFNRELLLETQNVNFFAISNLEIPTHFYNTIFLVLYSVFLILVFDSIIAFKTHKNKKFSKEIFALKSKLYDEREDDFAVFITEQRQKIDDFVKNQEEAMSKMISENNSALEKQKTDTDRILSKLSLLDEWVLDKIKKTFKAK